MTRLKNLQEQDDIGVLDFFGVFKNEIYYNRVLKKIKLFDYNTGRLKLWKGFF